MTVSINGSGGITYPDGSVNTTRSASTAGDTFTGAVQFNGGLAHKGSSDFIMERTDGYDYSFVVSTAHNATGKGVFFQKAGGGAITGSWNFRGKVLKPDQPAFLAYATTSAPSTISAQTLFTQFDGTKYNTGSCYNTSTKRFTAPVTGFYWFYTHIDLTGINQYGMITFLVNGAQVNGQDTFCGVGAASGTTTQGINLNIGYYLNAGDYVELFCRNVAFQFYTGHSHVGGFLVG